MRLTVSLLLSAIAAAGAFSAAPETRRDALQSIGLLGITAVVGPAFANADGGFSVGGKLRFGDESIMDQKDHGSSAVPVQENLRYGVSRKMADRISNYNRRFAELGGYFQETTFEDVVRAANGPVTFYDSNTGKALFQAPIGRSVDEFIDESKVHGWPSFRDNEVVWDNVRVLKNSGEDCFCGWNASRPQPPRPKGKQIL